MDSFEYIQTTELEGVHVIHLCDLGPDKDKLAQVGQELLTFASEVQPARLLINFRHVTLLSAPAVAKLLQMIKTVKAGGGHVECCEVRENLQKVLALLGRSLPFANVSKPEADVLAILKRADA